MKIKGLGRLKRWGKQLWLKTQPHALILIYHRVAQLDLDPQLLAVSSENFAQHLQIIRQFYQPLSLRELTQHLQQGNIPHRGVVITFDDGYADNFHEAKPLLEQYNIPATMFVTGGYLDKLEEFWWDDLERILLQPGRLPPRLSLSINNQAYHWELEDSIHYSQEDYQRHRNWNVLTPPTPTPRQEIYLFLCSLLRPLPTEARQSILQKIIIWAEQETIGRKTHRALTVAELKQLAQGGLVEIGAHSMTHPVLATLSPPQQLAEIEQSKIYLESILEQPVTSFAYPYGTQSDYNLETVTTVEKLGFNCTCANFPDVIWQKSNRFQLPRCLVRNWTQEQFFHRLGQYFNGGC